MLVELAVGDAYGAGFEYAEPDFVLAHNTLRAYVDNPVHPDLVAGRYTDDTQMSIAVAEVLASDGPWTAARFADAFVTAFRRDPRVGYARGFQALLPELPDGAALLARIRPDSDKSGAAMRAAPVGLLASVDDVLRTTAVQARITHNTPDGVKAAQAAALAVHYCHRTLGPVAEIGHWLDGLLPSGEWATPWTGPVGSKGLMSVRAAVTALASTTSMSALLRACVAFTGDVDTVATIALAAASRSTEITQDLPGVLLEGLERGPYGYDYLADLDTRLLGALGVH
ncbi:ADP-ribosylglycohydrolase family protein [Umezawaea sp. Da 62-37]|uniref:ADP-ribosylglycohydrolase family protein n=1 Tax=Umezawaea sp. Da 62-37 TaxID=3075927 RepID=UPI0028F70AD8|nr:ADP-ribosylglycohydrolase family protein [Umezawaea sp. Da 62-37]WNV86944.1 ADP-ribosylglycohydrolase family protein [Umezawaea sp. Da 62-37]